jgi:DTW domain-containing protein
MCALVPSLETRTRVLLVIHRLEDRKPTNTGRLATLCLKNSEVHVRGHADRPRALRLAPDGSLPVLLYPSEGARLLTEFAEASRPLTLIVPDGNWRQASKVLSRVPELRDVPCVTLPPGPPSTYRLRAEAHGHGLATVEAIARALGILEGPKVQHAIEHVFRVMVERTLWARGAIETRHVTEGIPSGAVRHDPRSGHLVRPPNT